MRFLVDAHLPRRLAHRLEEIGHDAIHTLDLPDRNRTSDVFIEEISLRDKRVVITKDSDFVSTYLLHGRPYKLLLVSTGNITNHALEQLFFLNIGRITEALEHSSFVELNPLRLITHS